MNEVTLTIRDRERSIHDRVHGEQAMRVVAALSADPETIEELRQALIRFQADSLGEETFRYWNEGDCESPWDEGVFIVDLAARLVVSESTYAEPAHNNVVRYFDGHKETDLVIRHGVSDRWVFRPSLESWREIAEQRRHELNVDKHMDTRAVLYDKFYSYAVQQCLKYARRSAKDPIGEIHKKWLMTPRDDLGGRTPRDILFADRHHLSRDLEHRASQWSRGGSCPPGLRETTAAYRFGGFGTNEWVFYYQFVRFVLEQCWSAIQHRPNLREAEETQRLAREAKTWLHTPREKDDQLSPFQIIDRERRRIPLTVSPDHAVVDDDCPLCQMMCESGPMFVHYDGSDMDDEFEFSWFETREEWEQCQWEFDDELDQSRE